MTKQRQGKIQLLHKYMSNLETELSTKLAIQSLGSLRTNFSGDNLCVFVQRDEGLSIIQKKRSGLLEKAMASLGGNARSPRAVI